MSWKRSHKNHSLYDSGMKSTLYEASSSMKHTKFVENSDELTQPENVTSSFFADISEEPEELAEHLTSSKSKDGNSSIIWSHITDADSFLREAYLYYANRGYSNILLSRMANIM